MATTTHDTLATSEAEMARTAAAAVSAHAHRERLEAILDQPKAHTPAEMMEAVEGIEQARLADARASRAEYEARTAHEHNVAAARAARSAEAMAAAKVAARTVDDLLAKLVPAMEAARVADLARYDCLDTMMKQADAASNGGIIARIAWPSVTAEQHAWWRECMANEGLLTKAKG